MPSEVDVVAWVATGIESCPAVVRTLFIVKTPTSNSK